MPDPWASLLEENWQQRIVFALPAPGVELGIGEYRLPPGTEIPFFADEVDTAISDEGVDWAAVAEAMVYVLAHAPVGSHVTLYAQFLEIWQPEITAYLTEQGVERAAAGQFKEGLICLRAATVIRPLDAAAHYNLGVCTREYAQYLAAMGDREKAQQAEAAALLALRRAAVLEPQFERYLASITE
ncbi:MAG TPA: hypothetical protein VIL07_09000 [Symbiobacteriaceae bacterium]